MRQIVGGLIAALCGLTLMLLNIWAYFFAGGDNVHVLGAFGGFLAFVMGLRLAMMSRPNE